MNQFSNVASALKYWNSYSARWFSRAVCYCLFDFPDEKNLWAQMMMFLRLKNSSPTSGRSLFPKIFPLRFDDFLIGGNLLLAAFAIASSWIFNYRLLTLNNLSRTRFFWALYLLTSTKNRRHSRGKTFLRLVCCPQFSAETIFSIWTFHSLNFAVYKHHKNSFCKHGSNLLLVIVAGVKRRLFSVVLI